MKKIIVMLIVIAMIPLVYSCNKKSEKVVGGTAAASKYFEDYNNSKLLDSLTDRIIKYGDTASFNKIKDIYMLSENSKKLLYLSMRMSDDYKFHRASMTTFGILRTNDTIRKNYKLANYYLLKAYEEGNNGAIYSINERFPKGKKIPKSTDYWDSIN